MSNNNFIKTLMVTGSNEDPRENDDWGAAYDLDPNKDYTLLELHSMANSQPHQYALWLYHGPEFEHKTSGEQYFHPWDHTEYLTLVRPACTLEEEDNFMDDWRKEIANEEGMLHGIDAYNDWMGY
jgi:hypothetical protein